MSPMTSALIDYWQRLPAESPAARRNSLDAIRDRVRAGHAPRDALVPFALGDTDEGIVATATRAYAAAPADTGDADRAGAAVEWVRRGLALNRGAVFGALLGLADAPALEPLAGLRLQLSTAEVEAACRVLGRRRNPLVQAFLQDWAELAADDPAKRAALAPGACAQAA